MSTAAGGRAVIGFSQVSVCVWEAIHHAHDPTSIAGGWEAGYWVGILLAFTALVRLADHYHVRLGHRFGADPDQHRGR